MALDPTIEEQTLLESTYLRDVSSTSPRERLAALVVLGGFLAASAALIAFRPPGDFELLPATACIGVLALAARISFETPLGFTVPTQLAFVPLLFSMPPALVPPTVAVSLMLARIPDLLRGSTNVERVLYTPTNACFALGPAAVFVIAGVTPRAASPLVLVLALLGQFTADTAGSTARIGIEREVGLREHLSYAWVYPIDAALSGIGLVVARQMEHSTVAVLALLPLLGVLTVFARERHGRLQSLLELKNAYRGTALVLGDVLEADDGYTGEHSKSVVELAIEVAERLGLDANQRRNIEFGALLHDVGKIAIPKDVLNKPGKLDPEEWMIIKTHTVVGQQMLDKVGGFMHEVGQIVRSHHERWDGAGYPDGLAGEAIPLESRIIACCDTWNAMRTDRVYRKALAFEAAMAELTNVSGSQLDPAMVAVLADVVRPDAPAPLPEATSRPSLPASRPAAAAR